MRELESTTPVIASAAKQSIKVDCHDLLAQISQ